MSKLISTLEQLHLLRHRAVEDLSQQLSSQRQQCQLFEKNIIVLKSLAAGMTEIMGNSATQLINHSGYKRNIQRVIDWQKQEQALAALEVQKIQGALLQEAKREKSLELVLDDRKRELALDRTRRDQKNTDAVSAQCWLRQKQAQR
jgi:flagellar export protein FliJ